jgi:hypothetical protein
MLAGVDGLYLECRVLLCCISDSTAWNHWTMAKATTACTSTPSTCSPKCNDATTSILQVQVLQPEIKAQIYSVQNEKYGVYESEQHPEHDVDYRSQGGPRLTYLYSSGEALTGNTLYLGGEIGCDGKIYCIPGHALRVLVIDPLKDHVYPIGPAFPGKFKWLRGIVVGEVIYGLPCNGSTVLRIHVPTRQMTELQPPYQEFYSIQNGFQPSDAMEQQNMLWKYHGGSISPKDGCIYVIPQSAWHVMKIDPRSDTISFVGPTFKGKYKWYGGVIGKADGAIYGIPHSATAVLRICPTHREIVTTHGDLGSEGHKWHGAAASADGTIVSVPANADTVLCIQPQPDSNQPKLFQIGNANLVQTGRHRSDNKYKYLGAMRGTDGKVYCFPSGSEQVLQVDTTTMTVQNVGPNLYDKHMERICQNKWQNGLTHQEDQAVYGIPLSGESVLRIDCSQPSSDASNVQVTTWKLPRPFRLLSKYEGGIVAPNGVMYTIPNNHKAVLRIEPPGRMSLSESEAQQGNQSEHRDAQVCKNSSWSSPTDNERQQQNASVSPSLAQQRSDNDINSNSTPPPKACSSMEEVMALTQITDGEDCTDTTTIYRSGIATLRSSAHRVKTNPKHRKQNPNPKDKSGQATKTTFLPESIRREETFAYDQDRYNLRKAFSELLSRCDPAIVGHFRTAQLEPALEDFVLPANTLHRQVNGGCCEAAQVYMSDAVAADANFLDIFDRLVEDVVLPYLKRRLVEAGEEDTPRSFYIQRPPTLRIQPGPGRAGVKPHHDGEYGHQNGELNFWLPLTDRNLNKVDLWCESSHQAADFHSILCDIGELISFHGSSCRHFVNRNDTDKTRVSMDFRIGIEGFFDPYWQMNGTTDDHGRKEIRL